MSGRSAAGMARSAFNRFFEVGMNRICRRVGRLLWRVALPLILPMGLAQAAAVGDALATPAMQAPQATSAVLLDLARAGARRRCA